MEYFLVGVQSRLKKFKHTLMQLLSDFFYRYSSFTLAILTTLFTAGYLGFVLTPAEESFSGSAFETTFSFEKSMGYSLKDATDYFEGKGEWTSHNTEGVVLNAETLYSLLYSSMCLMWLSYLWKPVYKNCELSQFINLLPLVLFLVELLSDSYFTDRALFTSQVLIGSTISTAKWTTAAAIYCLSAGGIFVRWYQTDVKTRQPEVTFS